jgi:hypothetical protein
MKAKKRKKVTRKASNISFLRNLWGKVKNAGESLLSWLEWNTHLVGSLGLVAAGGLLLCPSISLEGVLAWSAIAFGGFHLLVELKDRYL